MNFTEGKNYYEILGVSREATVQEIREAYKEIARVYHPDSNFYSEVVDQDLNGQQVDIFKAITAAYHTLSNKTKRVEYDKTLIPDLRGWVDEPEDDEELVEALERLGVQPETLGVKVPKQKRKRKNSEAFGIFGTAAEDDPLITSAGVIKAQFSVSAFRCAEEAFPSRTTRKNSKRATLTGIERPTVTNMKVAGLVDPQKAAPRAEQEGADRRMKMILLLFVANGSVCFLISVAAFFLLR